ncbi:MAG: hypothetical protein Q8R92_18530 [Deltaproteobacteria bacterium]|nr:hypothetical protein [Deltaproteobacteria bacterium]
MALVKTMMVNTLGWAPAFRETGMLHRLSRRRLKQKGLPPGSYAPGDAVIIEARWKIEAGEVVLAEIGGREALYRHRSGATVVRFEAGEGAAPGDVPIQVPLSDLRILGVVIGLRREGTGPRR